MGFNTGYKNSAGVDIGVGLVERSYLMDRYPELADTFKQAGLWVWGENSYGQLGDSTRTLKSSPIQTIAGGTNWKQVSNSYSTSGGIKTDGTLWLWGIGTSGEMGNNARTNRSSPVQTISGGTNWKQLSCGQGQTAAIKTDGTLWLWGSNYTGGLGTNTSGSTTARSSPVQTISGGTNWKQVCCGSGNTAAIKTDGTLWLWGINTYGQLGTNDVSSRSSPVQTVAGGTTWKQVSIGGTDSTAAIKTDGTLWVWGRNSYGQLGDSTLINKSSPIQTISGGTNWKQVSIGSSTAAIKTDGTLWVWGLNEWSQLGIGIAAAPVSSPIQTIAGGTNWKEVKVNTSSMIALKTDGTLWTWGRNASGILGNNNTNTSQTPVQTIAGGTNWKNISSFGGTAYFNFAIRDDSSDPL